MFQRTTLAGAFLLCAVLANVVMVDLCYGVDVGAMLIALMLLAGMVWLVPQEGKRQGPVLASGRRPVALGRLGAQARAGGEYVCLDLLDRQL